ncbi:DinB/UmuC family translesion DNA polymerase [Streptomyces aurantiogriseus]|uniref:DNA polymerase Y-family little finger domain-containing protein n=1 Tax=Streptomyces aurantiogriseus TaxID=66870 RepID=A0A918FMM1_9ACTN|nr:hypothetical protein [Streptomyces aurantiogriseus]GGR55218.1 hypothetical protein GCM10010251_85320 [Streptomyces aurantiogriseus]
MLERDCLDPAQHHPAVLGLADQIGQRLRGESQIASRLTLTVRYADRSSTMRTLTLPEPTNHSPALATATLSLLAGLGLQRASIRAFVIRADNLLSTGRACRQLSLDPGDARARAAEAAADRAGRRFGPEAIRPAAVANRPLVPRTRRMARSSATLYFRRSEDHVYSLNNLEVESGSNSGCKYCGPRPLPVRHIRAFRVSNVVPCRSVADILDADALGSTCRRCLLAGRLWLNLSTDGASSSEP